MSVLPLLAALAFFVGAYCFGKSATRWDTGLIIAAVVTMFGGIAAVNLGSGAYLVLFRDVFVVLPLYLGFFSRRSGQLALGRLPADVLLILTLLIAAIMLALFNPAGGNVLQVLIGLKVWLYYIPFIAIGLALAYAPDRLFRFLRHVLIWGFIASAIGLAQSVLVRLLGYQRVIGWFFGSHAVAVTQGFSGFDVAGGIYRIPGTFSFLSQYAAFLYFYISVAMIEANADDDPRIRKFAHVALFVAVMASFLCGAREAIVFVPATLLGFIICGLLSPRLLLIAPVAIGAGIALLRLSDLNLVAYFFYGTNLADSYLNNFIWQEIVMGFDYGPIGAGIGSSTTAARYAMGGIAGGLSNAVSAIGIESSYGKATAELGWLGFASMALIMGMIAARSAGAILRSWTSRSSAIVAPLAIYLAHNVIVSFKGTVLDIDPPNIMIWLSLGIMIGVTRQVGAASFFAHPVIDDEIADVSTPLLSPDASRLS